MLMEMKKVDVALDKAVESGDPQLGELVEWCSVMLKSLHPIWF